MPDQGLPQPAYQGNNWFTTPALPNYLNWSMETTVQQYLNNKATYASKGWFPYPDGAYETGRNDTTSPPIPDWAPGDATPAWEPIAGGKGWGIPNKGGPPAGPATASAAAASVAPGASNGKSSALIDHASTKGNAANRSQLRLLPLKLPRVLLGALKAVAQAVVKAAPKEEAKLLHQPL